MFVRTNNCEKDRAFSWKTFPDRSCFFDSVIYRKYPYNYYDSMEVASLGGVVSAGGSMVLNIPAFILLRVG